MEEKTKRRMSVDKYKETKKMQDLVWRVTASKWLTTIFLATLMSTGMAAYLCDGIEHPRTVDKNDVQVIKERGKITIILEGNYDVLMPHESAYWQSSSMGWSMAPGYMYIINYDDPALGDIASFNQDGFGVSHQVSAMNGTYDTTSVYGTTESGWTDDDYYYKYAGAIFIKS